MTKHCPLASINTDACTHIHTQERKERDSGTWDCGTGMWMSDLGLVLTSALDSEKERI